MGPTKERRLEIYKLAFKYIETYAERYHEIYNTGICWAIAMVKSDFKETPYPDLESYPEILSYKPENAGVYWWPNDEIGVQKRIEVLKEVIFQMEKE